MANVTLAHRFPPRSVVRLVHVAGDHVLRAEGAEEVGAAVVGADGIVRWTAGVVAGERYLAVGVVDGYPLEVRTVGVEHEPLPPQPPVRGTRTGVAP